MTTSNDRNDEGRDLAALAGLLADGTRAGLGLTLADSRRAAVRSGLDWTERRPHLSGAVGALVCRHAFDVGWITRITSQ